MKGWCFAHPGQIWRQWQMIPWSTRKMGHKYRSYQNKNDWGIISTKHRSRLEHTHTQPNQNPCCYTFVSPSSPNPPKKDGKPRLFVVVSCLPYNPIHVEHNNMYPSHATTPPSNLSNMLCLSCYLAQRMAGSFGQCVCGRVPTLGKWHVPIFLGEHRFLKRAKLTRTR